MVDKYEKKRHNRNKERKMLEWRSGAKMGGPNTVNKIPKQLLW